jgi:hypothetical protein
MPESLSVSVSANTDGDVFHSIFGSYSGVGVAHEWSMPSLTSCSHYHVSRLVPVKTTEI